MPQCLARSRRHFHGIGLGFAAQVDGQHPDGLAVGPTETISPSFNSLSPERYGANFKCVILQSNLLVAFMSIYSEITYHGYAMSEFYLYVWN